MNIMELWITSLSGLSFGRSLGRIGADKGGQSAGALKPFAVSALWQSLRPPR